MLRFSDEPQDINGFALSVLFFIEGVFPFENTFLDLFVESSATCL